MSLKKFQVVCQPYPAPLSDAHEHDLQDSECATEMEVKVN